jgi:chitinase
MAAGEPLPSASTSPDATQNVVVAENQTAPFSNTTVKTTSGYRNALYFTNWLVTCMIRGECRADHLRGIYGADTQPQELPADKITHVLYAFADIAPDGEV